MSEQTKNKPNTAEIVVSIICALILIVTLGLFARNVINAAREDESRRQSEADESLYRHDTADAEQLRLREAFAAVCKKHKVNAQLTVKSVIHEPYSNKYIYDETEDPIKYEIEVSLKLDPPEKIKDWKKFYYFLDELDGVKPDYPFICISLHTYYVGEYVTGSGEEHEINYSAYISRQNLISVNDGREIHFLGIKTDKGITPVSEILPYEGMPEELINSTKLGKATAVNYDPLKYSKFYDQTVARREGYHEYYWKIPYYAKQSEYSAWLYAYYSVDVRNGAVESVWHYPEYETVPKQTPSSGGSSSGGSYRPSGNRPVTTTKKAYYDDDPYNARDFNDPEDFYDYYYDDFEDYEEAYDYFYEHNPD